MLTKFNDVWWEFNVPDSICNKLVYSFLNMG